MWAAPTAATVVSCRVAMAVRMVSRPTEKQAQTFFSALAAVLPERSVPRASSGTGAASMAASCSIQTPL